MAGLTANIRSETCHSMLGKTRVDGHRCPVSVAARIPPSLIAESLSLLTGTPTCRQKKHLVVAGLRDRIWWLNGEQVIEVTSVSASSNSFFWFAA